MGLFGELQYMCEHLAEDSAEIVKMWNGPLNTAQDYQSNSLASEIKTTRANTIDEITISDLAQLYLGIRKHLFLIVYRMELDGSEGLTIPEMIEKTKKLVPSEDLDSFMAKLWIKGYNPDLADQYVERFSVLERQCYDVREGFPCLNVDNVPKEIKDAQYRLSLRNCEKYLTDFEEIIDAYKG